METAGARFLHLFSKTPDRDRECTGRMRQTPSPASQPSHPSHRTRRRGVGAGPAHDEYDVVVVGARVAGAATAMLLARRGLRVLCVDRAAAGSDTLSTHTLVRGGVLQLERWGLLDRLRAAGTPRGTTIEFHYGGEPLRLDLSGDDGSGGLYSPRRTVLDAMLADAAREAGAEVHHLVPVSGLVTDAGRVAGVHLGRGSSVRAVRARWVVGADGIRSGVAAAAGAPAVHRERATSTVVYGYWRGVRDDVIVNVFDRRGRAAGIFPTNDGLANVWVALPPRDYEREVRGDIRGASHRLVAEDPTASRLLRGATPAGGYRSFPGMPGFLRRAHGPGWALVGDAGYWKDPVSAHGITDALIGAELLADALGDVLLAGADPREALGGYEQRRDAGAAALMPPTARLAAMDLDGPAAMLAFREIAGALRREVDELEARAVAAP